LLYYISVIKDYSDVPTSEVVLSTPQEGVSNSDSMEVDVPANARAASTQNQSLDILTHTLHWGHLCPTAPGMFSVLYPFTSNLSLVVDTLACHPYENNDPFVIAPNEIPNVLFCGNQVSNHIVKRHYLDLLQFVCSINLDLGRTNSKMESVVSLWSFLNFIRHGTM
jgi:hypothetical protein